MGTFLKGDRTVELMLFPCDSRAAFQPLAPQTGGVAAVNLICYGRFLMTALGGRGVQREEFNTDLASKDGIYSRQTLQRRRAPQISTYVYFSKLIT